MAHHALDYRAWFWGLTAADRATFLDASREVVATYASLPPADRDELLADAWAILRAHRDGAPMAHVEPGDAA